MKIFFRFCSGVYNIFIKQGDQDIKVGCCDNKGSFGELALMYNMPRAATVQSAGDGLLWAMDRQTFRRIVLRNAFQKRKMYEALLEKVPLLSSLNVSCNNIHVVFVFRQYFNIGIPSFVSRVIAFW